MSTPPPAFLKPRILVVGGKSRLHQSIHGLLGRDYDVHHAYFLRLACQLVNQQAFDLVLAFIEPGPDETVSALLRTIEALPPDARPPVLGLVPSRTPEQEVALSPTPVALKGTDALFAWPRQAADLCSMIEQRFTPLHAFEPAEVTLPPFFGVGSMV